MPATDLLSLDRAAMERLFDGMGEKRYHAHQVLRWLHQRGVVSCSAMTDLSRSLRVRLQRETHIGLPEIAARHKSTDGTIKWLLRLPDGNSVETVFIPEAERGTLCVSSQAGCALNCTFCATGRQGFSRNLTAAEIIGQVWIAKHDLDDHRSSGAAPHRRLTNVVMMGMGEPLLNLDQVIPALNLMLDDLACGLSRRRVTVSTAGMVPGIDRLGHECPVSLAVSLHAPHDELREQLVPLNRKYPIAELLAACRRYAADHRQRITFEYVMLAEVNDQPSHARALASLLGDIPAKVNLIPFNPSPGIPYRRSEPAAIDRFRDILMARHLFTITRKTRGDDIAAACGQLAGEVRDRTGRATRRVRFNTVAA